QRTILFHRSEATLLIYHGAETLSTSFFIFSVKKGRSFAIKNRNSKEFEAKIKPAARNKKARSRLILL
ncbi:hypothetical protein MGA3_16758, partial [Bacillus methanolicus MGA3]